MQRESSDKAEEELAQEHSVYLILGRGGGGVGRVRRVLLDALQDSTSPDWTRASQSSDCTSIGGPDSPSGQSQNKPYRVPPTSSWRNRGEQKELAKTACELLVALLRLLVAACCWISGKMDLQMKIGDYVHILK